MNGFGGMLGKSVSQLAACLSTAVVDCEGHDLACPRTERYSKSPLLLSFIDKLQEFILVLERHLHELARLK